MSWQLRPHDSGAPRRNRPPRRTRPLALEALEDRRLLSSDIRGTAPGGDAAKALIDGADKAALALTIDRGDGYLYQGDRIALTRRTDKIAVLVGTPPAAAGRSKVGLEIAADPLRGLPVDRTLDNGVKVIDLGVAPGLNLDAAIADVASRAGVSWAAPVFYNPESDTEIVVTDETIVALDPGVDPARFFAGRGDVVSYRPLVGTPDQFVAVLNVGAGAPTLEATAALDGADGVAWASPNFYMDLKKFFMPNDPLASRQWHLNNTNQTGGLIDADVDAPEAWDLAPGGSPNVVIAVVDDGMEYTHPDLAPNLFVNAGEIAGNGIDDDGNGWVDDRNGWDFTSAGGGDNDPGPSTTSDAHATSVGGVAAGAGDNALGSTGMAYKSRLLPVRIFLGSSATSAANIASAIYYAAGRTANGLGTWRAGDVMNNSWGGGSADAAITAAFTWATASGRDGKGVVTFISSGNGGTGTVSYPANLSTSNPGVIAVGSVDATDRWSYSQYGTGLDVMASSDGPDNFGTFAYYMDGVVTTDRQGTNGYNPAAGTAGNYTTTAESGFGGTSSASPLTAGIGALMLSLDGTLTAAQVKRLLRNTTELVGGVNYVNGATAPWNNQYGYGRVSAFKALQAIGAKRIGVQNETTTLPSGTGVSTFTAAAGATQDRRIYIRNEGTQPLNIGTPTVTAGTPYSILTPPPVSTLGLGETTSLVVRYAPASIGAWNATLSFATDVAGLSTYTVNLAGTATTTAAVSGRVYHDIDNSGTPTASDTNLAGVFVYADANNNGTFDQSTATFTSSQVPRSMTLGGFVGTGVTVAGTTGVLTDLNVRVNVGQTGTAGLHLYLVSPTGLRIALGQSATGSNTSFTNTVFDDQAGAAIGTGAAPFTGTFRPLQGLSAFNGISPNGAWALQVVGLAASSSTTISGFSLEVSTATETFAVTDASGNYSLGQLPTGANNIRVAAPAGLIATNPAVPLQVINLPAANSTATGVNFAFQLANAVYGWVYHDRNADASQQAGEEVVNGWVAFNDANNNGVLDTGVTIASTDVPKSLPDNATVNSITTVSGLSGSISDVNVRVNMTHTWVSDVQLVLISPTGVQVPLITNRGGSGDNFVNTVFDDQAATAISAGAAPFTGSFRPESPLSALNGADPNGTWTLRMTDTATGDPGTLTGWSLTINTGVVEVPVPVLASGYYVVPGVAAGPYNVRLLPRAGWSVTGPPGAVNSGTMPAGGNANGATFGVIQADAIYGKAFMDANANGVDNAEAGVGGRVVFLDANNNGQLDGSTATLPSTNVPVAIPDNTTVTSTRAVSGLLGVVTDVNVTINITHTWVADLAVALISPSGTVISLVANRGSNGDNFVNTVFDDEAAAAISTGAAPFTGSFRPETPLSALDGQSPNGTWTLRITDSATGDTGTLTGWSMTISSGETSTVTDAFGQYQFANLPAGTHAVRQSPGTAPDGYRWTTPSWYSVPLSAGTTAHNRNFGQAAAAVSGFVIDNGTAQRSMVRSITMLVDGRISTAPGAAFSLLRTGGGTPISFNLVVGSFTYVGDNATRVQLTFAGDGLAAGALQSLPDGIYSLTVNGNAIVNGGVALDGNADGTPGGSRSQSFFRFFGDSNGDGLVDAVDFLAFRAAYNSGNAGLWSIYDANGDGAFTIDDLAAFNDNFRKRRLS